MRGGGQAQGGRKFFIETSILKIIGSEVLDFVVDETLQIHGGIGFTTDLAVERHYRDSRINRIFEGTNEINRLLLCSTLPKRIAVGEINVDDPQRLSDPSRMPVENEPIRRPRQSWRPCADWPERSSPRPVTTSRRELNAIRRCYSAVRMS